MVVAAMPEFYFRTSTNFSWFLPYICHSNPLINKHNSYLCLWGSNRTLVELKDQSGRSAPNEEDGSNRTLVELKGFEDITVRVSFMFQSYLSGIERMKRAQRVINGKRSNRTLVELKEDSADGGHILNMFQSYLSGIESSSQT